MKVHLSITFNIVYAGVYNNNGTEFYGSAVSDNKLIIAEVAGHESDLLFLCQKLRRNESETEA